MYPPPTQASIPACAVDASRKETWWTQWEAGEVQRETKGKTQTEDVQYSILSRTAKSDSEQRGGMLENLF